MGRRTVEQAEPGPFSCVITVEGGGTGYGGRPRPKDGKTGPLGQFIVDNDFYYGKVARHVRACQVCDPLAVLLRYLERRKALPKFQGQTSGGLVKLALKYRSILRARGRDLPEGVLQEFVWRSGALGVYREHQGILTMRQVYDAVVLVRDADAANCAAYQARHGHPHPEQHSWTWREFPRLERFRQVQAIVEAGFSAPADDEELDKMLAVTEVMAS